MTDAPKPKVEVLVALDGGSLAAWLPITLLASPAFIALTKSAHLVLARIMIARASGHHHIRHWEFQQYGVPRDSVTHAIAELEGLGIIRVQRHTAKANSFGISDKWREIATIGDARRIRDAARNFGIIARRKRERATARVKRAQHQEDHHDDDNLATRIGDAPYRAARIEARHHNRDDHAPERRDPNRDRGGY
jgi:hypothetical protein